MERDFSGEFQFEASRSSGPGGQNVNKVSSKVELRFDVLNSKLLSDEEKELIYVKLKNKITLDGILIITSQTERSQLKNKELCIEKFYKILETALKKTKKRIKVKPTKAMIEKRLQSKKETSEKKQNRKKIDI